MAGPRRRAGNFRMSKASWGSPASKGASNGSGPVMGAGQLNTPHMGPGKAAMRYSGMNKEAYPNRPTPTGEAPRGMDVYREGSAPPRGYRQ